MNKKSLLTSVVSFFSFFLFSALFLYFLIFSWPTVFWNEISEVSENSELDYILSNNIYTDTNSLNNTILIFNSNKDIRDYKFVSKCDIKANFVETYKNLYLFEIELLDGSCVDKNISLVNDKNELLYTNYFNVLSEYEIYSKLLDYSTKRLLLLKSNLNNKIDKYLKYWEFSKELNIDYFWYLKKKRILYELKYNQEIVDNIVKWRDKKYIIPVNWEKMPYLYSKVPNSARWYRANYTDWIHQGWDIWHKFWDNVFSVDDWIIVRIVSGFKFSDLNNIKYWQKLTYEDKLKNLDVLRWNQIWLKTLKWDVVIYSHLNEIKSNIVEWSVVKKWKLFWAIWITGVPDKNYKDYHLHLEVYKNPYNDLIAWNYSILDYMKWDWYFKWESIDFVLKNQSALFNEDYKKMWYVNN